MRNLNFVLSDHENMSQSEFTQLQELYPQRPLIEVLQDLKDKDLENISDHLSTGRPLGDGLAVCKKVSLSNSIFFNRSNTKALNETTLPHLMQQFNNANSEGYFQSYNSVVPQYLNTACLPFV